MISNEMARLSGDERAAIDEHLKRVPVKLGSLARSLGLAVLSSTMPVGVSGELRPDAKGGFVVRVNRHDSPKRQRFTVAHEIAHFLLHRDQIGDGITDDVLYRSSLSDARESEANRLAADLLMPEADVRKAFSDISDVGEAKIDKMAGIFDVSGAAMRIRLEVLGLI